MDELSARISELGKAVKDVSDRTTDPATLNKARRRWMAIPARAPTAKRPATMKRAAWLVAFAAAACLACLAVMFAWSHHKADVSFELGSPPVRGAIGEWVGAADATPLDVRFSEGTTLRLSPGGRLRVTETNSHGAALLVERGRLHAFIQHRGPETRWAVRAGPFEVRVTGTRFDVAWDPSAETFELVMDEGSVVVSGPALPPERMVVGGERLTVSVRDRRMELTSADRAEVPESPVATPPMQAPSPECPPSAVPSGSTAAEHASIVTGNAPAPNWKALAAAGKYRDAIAAAEHAGFAQEIERASSAELLALSDAARFAGRADRAREALIAMRTRFGARGRSAFLLGKIAADQNGSPAEAVRWFEAYLQEEPGGPLAEQALGRILELKSHGDKEAARTAAERYLARYPNGAYAALARSVVVP